MKQELFVIGIIILTISCTDIRASDQPDEVPEQMLSCDMPLIRGEFHIGEHGYLLSEGCNERFTVNLSQAINHELMINEIIEARSSGKSSILIAVEGRIAENRDFNGRLVYLVAKVLDAHSLGEESEN